MNRATGLHNEGTMFSVLRGRPAGGLPSFSVYDSYVERINRLLPEWYA